MYSAHEYVVMSMHMVAPTSSAVIVSNGLCPKLHISYNTQP